MADERGIEFIDLYSEILHTLKDGKGLLGDIFAKAMPKFNNPVNLKHLINMFDEEVWASMKVDVKGAAFESLLEKAASEGKKAQGNTSHQDR